MSRFSGNRPNRTLTLHKEDCHHISADVSRPCGCGSTSTKSNQEWWCEAHVSLEVVSTFMRNRFWAILFCDRCFGPK
jgi:hypothetical protein